MDDEQDHIPAELRSALSRLRGGEAGVTLTVRTLLSWFGAQRRGSVISDWISATLDECGAVTEPDFRGAWIDGEIELRLARSIDRPERSVLEGSDVETNQEPETLAPAISFDPTYRIGRLFAANQAVVGVPPDGDISEAITLMLQRDYSQLPVQTSERNVKGVVTWKSIASRVALAGDYSKIRFCMEAHREVRSEVSLFDVIPIVVESGYVLVRGSDERIVGIVTASDLSLQFRQLAEPFLLLSEIEQHVRKLIGGRVSASDLKAACDPADQREIEKVSDLTLGEMIRLLENPIVWGKLDLHLISRAKVTADLLRVRAIRNDVMHFDPDPLDEGDIQFLGSFSRFLQRLDEIRNQ